MLIHMTGTSANTTTKPEFHTEGGHNQLLLETVFLEYTPKNTHTQKTTLRIRKQGSCIFHKIQIVRDQITY